MAFTGRAVQRPGTELPPSVEDVSDIIGIVSPHETPLLDHLGDAKRAAMSSLHGWIEPNGKRQNFTHNFTQIFTARINVSGSMQASRAYGVADEVDYQKQERIRELLRDLENCVINGVAPASDGQGSGTVRRSMNGILHSIQTNMLVPGMDGIPDGDGEGADQLNEAVLNAAIKSVCGQSGGNIDTIVVGGAQKRRINSFASGSRAYLPDDQVFSDMISVYESDFGVCRVVMSRWVPSDKVLLLDSSRISVMPLAGRSFHYKQLASDDDSISGQVLGEYTLEFKNENAHGVISGLGA